MATACRLSSGAAGLVLVGVGLAVLFSGGLALPTRHPPIQFHFGGLPLVLLALGPLLAGSLVLALAFEKLQRDDRAVRVLALSAMAATGLAFVLAPQG